MSACKIVKSASKDEKQSGQPRAAAARMHEFPGVPNNNGNQRFQPVRLKDLMMSADGKKSAKSVQDTIDCCSSQKKPERIKLLGLLMSEGKLNKTNDSGREPPKPEKMKAFMESWERSQSRVRSERTTQPCTASVRRKLYTGVPSSTPAKPEKTNIAETNIARPLDQKSTMLNRKSLKPEVSRKSSRLPRYSIRDKSTNLHQNDSIKEESKTIQRIRKNCKKVNVNEKVILTGKNDRETELSNGIGKSGTLAETKGILVMSEKKKEKRVEFLSPEKGSTDGENSDERTNDEQRKIDNSTKIMRPTVIKEISAANDGLPKEQRSKLTKDKETSPFAISRPPSGESKITDSRCPRLDANDTSFEDLFSNSQGNNGARESFYNENLPGKSFLEPTEMQKNTFINLERESMLWMHGNLKIAVQSAEEQLFTMRMVLKALEEAIKSNDNSRPEVIDKEIVSDDISSSPKLSSVDRAEVEKKQNTNDPLIENRLTEISTIRDTNIVEETLDTDEEYKENVRSFNDGDGGKSGKKPRRRSLRLASQNSESSKCSNDSFSRFENELNIMNVKKQKQNSPINDRTEKRVDPRARRSIREYMALKSTMNFLQTPDFRGLPTPKAEKDTPSHRLSTRRSLSRKLLLELDDLYADSPM